jgi:asparagine synthase (glutamine-hydrolysing)
MCRIAGFIDSACQHPEQDVTRMRDVMWRGGPDSEGIYLDPEVHLALGHRRLSIIDMTSCGNQPMISENGQMVLVFNGEIYNYREIQQDLERDGFRFFSHSDTEVILKAYEKWGTACFSKFKGMFALSIYDKRKNQLVLARDHAGIKPLYFYADAKCLYFASEVRAFAATEKVWDEHPYWRIYFLTYGFLPSHVTTIRGVKALDKGSFMVINTRALETRHEYFYKDRFSENITDAEEAKELVRNAIRTSVKYHLIADAPLGVFLSGGIDSSLITLLAAEDKDNLKTLSIVFEDEKFSEKYYQEIVAAKACTNHSSFLLTKDDFTKAVPDILHAMDQPSADGINSYFISKFAKEAGLKAVLSGLGADELFGGYPSFGRHQTVKKLKLLPAFIRDKAHHLPGSKYHKISFLGKGLLGDYLFNRGYFSPRETSRLLDVNESEVESVLFHNGMIKDISELSAGNQTSYLESSLYMENQLLKDTDYMSMWHSVEVRVPFLDIDVIKAVHSISSNIKFSRQGKVLLTDSFMDILPAEIWNRKKKGFQLPFDNWMQESLDDFIQTKQEQQVREQFTSGRLSWSRYWTFLLSRNFHSMPI